MESHVTNIQTGPPWTDEKHLHFLNSIETYFVRTMFQNNNNNNLSRSSHHLLRLDRYLPDCSESTLDLRYSHRRTRRHPPLGLMGPRKRIDGRRLRRRSSEPYNSSQDQQESCVGTEHRWKRAIVNDMFVSSLPSGGPTSRRRRQSGRF